VSPPPSNFNPEKNFTQAGGRSVGSFKPMKKRRVRERRELNEGGEVELKMQSNSGKSSRMWCYVGEEKGGGTSMRENDPKIGHRYGRERRDMTADLDHRQRGVVPFRNSGRRWKEGHHRATCGGKRSKNRERFQKKIRRSPRLTSRIHTTKKEQRGTAKQITWQ